MGDASGVINRMTMRNQPIGLRRRGKGLAPSSTGPSGGAQASKASAVEDELVGRERERTALEHALGGPWAGRGGIVLLAGDAGVGKTRLAEHVLQGRDVQILRGDASEQVFRAASQRLDGAAFEPRPEAPGERGAQIGAMQRDVLEAEAFHHRLKLAPRRLDLGKFRHGRYWPFSFFSIMAALMFDGSSVSDFS